MPRHTDHTGFGLRDLHRCLRGPRYAARLSRAAPTRPASTVADADELPTGVGRPATLALTAPGGLVELAADAVIVLASGCRERRGRRGSSPAIARAACSRPGMLQQLVTLHGAPVGRRAVVVGAEHVSFSAVLTLAHAGADDGRAGDRGAAPSELRGARVASPPDAGASRS